MALLNFDAKKCNLCGFCIKKCPFDALSMLASGIDVNEKCRMCGVCVRTCPEGAIRFEQKAGEVDKSKWNDILVFCEVEKGEAHKVVFELIGEAKRLAKVKGYNVNVVIVGEEGLEKIANELLEYGVSKVYIYEHKAFKGFRADNYADALADCISSTKPSVVLIGATAIGRSIAPRLSTRFHTGLTADCTKLEMRENSDLVQIRPAFGGNIMAQILISNSRPQFATVRYKVMENAKKVEKPFGEIIKCEVSEDLVKSRIFVEKIEEISKEKTIEEEDVLVVCGRGVKNKSELDLIYELANLLGGQVAFTRPMVEAGFGTSDKQIGLSGRTVKPKLMITIGVSGAIQFSACIKGSECVVAINSDKNAPIFKNANYCVVEDFNNVIPKLIERIKRGGEA